MIVRIAGEGRWRLADDAARRLLADDLRLMRAVDESREVEYEYLLVALCRYVRVHGERVSDVADGEADITVPSPDMSLDETIELLSQPGLHPEAG
jgi:hypothetical protein